MVSTLTFLYIFMVYILVYLFDGCLSLFLRHVGVNTGSFQLGWDSRELHKQYITIRNIKPYPIYYIENLKADIPDRPSEIPEVTPPA